MGTARLTTVDLPDFGMPEVRPEVPGDRYGKRLAALRERADAAGFDRLVVYADREHSANLAFLSGFDPRFEEAMLIVGPASDPLILVGNECFGMAGAAPLPMRRERFQDFSLPSQPRDRSRGWLGRLKSWNRSRRIGSGEAPAIPKHSLPTRISGSPAGPTISIAS
ncbi:MAG TPA: hypothetical protein VIZ22_10130, partial [Candidatus Limnocylindrales bacterium]